MVPDTLAAVIARLKADTAVTAIAGQRISDRVPARAVFPRIRVTRIGTRPVRSLPVHMDAGSYQIDCFAGNNRQAHELARTSLAALVGWVGAITGGHVTGTEYVTLSNQPDREYDPPKQRYLLEVIIYAHS